MIISEGKYCILSKGAECYTIDLRHNDGWFTTTFWDRVQTIPESALSEMHRAAVKYGVPQAAAEIDSLAIG